MTENSDIQDENRILILGVGNYILKDEGVGVHAIEYMQDKKLPDHVDILDGGTGGFYLLSVIQNYKKVILIDATMDGKEEGTVSVLKPKFSNDFPKALTTHDIGLKDLLDTANLLGLMADVHLITVTVENIQDMGIDLTPKIKEVLPRIYETVLSVLKEKT